MANRPVLAGILGGIGMFLWSSVAHMALPLGDVGIREIPNEEAVLAPMSATLGHESGMYLFPGMGSGTNSERQARYEKKTAANPSGMLIYHPPGAPAMTPGQLITEFAKEMLMALGAVLLLARTKIFEYSGRVGFLAAIGAIAAVGTNVSYWNWYGFPSSYTVAAILIEWGGFLVAGLIAAAMVKPAPMARVARVP